MSKANTILQNSGDLLKDLSIPDLTSSTDRALISRFNIQPDCKITRSPQYEFRANFVVGFNIPRITKDPQIFIAGSRPVLTYKYSLPDNHKKPLHYLTDFFHVQKENGEKQLHLISECVVIDCDEWQERNLVSRIDLIKQTHQAGAEYVFKSTPNVDSAYQLLKNNNGQLEEVNTLDEAIIAFRLLHSVWIIIQSMYQKKQGMERRIQDYIQGFIHNQYWCYFYSSPIRNAYFYIIERYMLAKYKDLHVHPNKIFHLYLDEYWRVHDQDYLYQPSSEGQRSEILSIVAETKKTREKIDVFLSINDTRLARNQLLHGYQFTPALNKLLINLPYLLNTKQLHLIWLVFNMIGGDRLVGLFNTLIKDHFYHINMLNTFENGLASGEFVVGSLSVVEEQINTLMYVFLLGFSFKQIANVLEAHTVTYLQECISMYRRELSFNPNYKVTHSHIRQWHDEMVAVNQQRRMLKKMQEDEQKRKLYDKPHISRFTQELCRGYVFKPIQNANELFFIGSELRNCIGWSGHIDEVVGKRVDIVTICQDEKLIAVMDINIDPQFPSPMINQAKMYDNVPARNETGLLDAIIAWSINNKVRYDTSKDLLW